jgi:hypothetical protein
VPDNERSNMPTGADAAARQAFFKRYGDVNKQLRLFEGKQDPESVERWSELIEELMCMDMALRAYRKAMARAHRDVTPPSSSAGPTEGERSGSTGGDH